MDITRLFEKVQIVIPKRVRTAHGWEPGLEFVVEETDDGVKLKPIKPFKTTKIDDVPGCLKYKGPKKSLHDMETAIARGAKKSLSSQLTRTSWSACLPMMIRFKRDAPQIPWKVPIYTFPKQSCFRRSGY
jgi:AbrB family looped-hinge helix DNA binding protein